MRKYIAEIKRHTKIVERLVVEATDRGQAVRKTQLHFWYTYRGSMGFAHESIVVDDPYTEVTYSPTFRCKDKKNLLLPETVIERLLQEANGELIRDTRQGSRHSQRGCVRRVKRRRDFGKFIAPCIRQMKNGKLYYRVNLRPPIVRNGRRYRKRKYQDVPLEARTLVDAVKEIQSRELPRYSITSSKRKMASRDTRVLELITGLIPTPSRIPKKYRNILRRYQAPLQESVSSLQ